MDAISNMAAIKRFMERDNGRAVASRELIDFKKACTDQEWNEFGASAASQLGTTIAEAA